MSNFFKYSIRDLNDCGCCEGLTARTPVTLNNRPGLNAIAYRVGNHASFKQSLLARLSASDYPMLAGLRTRDNDDFSVALLDAWATVADVLTFYQERIANESYLRTATERVSLLELARLIGYELNPGVAASACLAFTLEEAPGAPDQAVKRTTIDIGVKVQSTPGPDEQAQTYETVERIEARAEWNVMRPRLSQPQQFTGDMHSLVLEGATLNIENGNLMLVEVNASNRQIKRVVNVEIHEDNQTTRVDFDSPEYSPSSYERPSLKTGSIEDFEANTELDDTVLEEIVGKTWRVETLSSLAKIQGWPLEKLAASVNEQLSLQAGNNEAGVFVFRQRANVFGHNAVKKVTYDPASNHPEPASEWDEWRPALGDERNNVIYLDNAYEKVVPKSYVAIHKQGGPSAEPYEVLEAVTRPRTEYGLSLNTTRLVLDRVDRDWWKVILAGDQSDSSEQPNPFTEIRNTTVHVLSERLSPAEVPIEEPVEGDAITLDRAYLGLKRNQLVILTGERIDRRGAVESEVKALKEVWIEGGRTVLVFDTSLSYSYVRETVTVNANVARATHGESVHEILGSGDAGRPDQRFTLRQPPLTHVSAETPSGGESTLEVRVNDVRWHAAPSFFQGRPDDRIFATKTDGDGKTTVLFGDGISGARLPSGENNVRARYRKGIGLGGLVKARQLNQLMTRPLGVKEAVNPVAASGAEDPESLYDARLNVPLTVLTLDRTVSLKDYEDFARAFAGIAKAHAIRTWHGKAQQVFITVAGPKGKAVESDSNTCKNLSGALQKAGDPYVNLTVKSYRPAFFRIEGGMYVGPDYLPDKVLAEIQDILREHFSFEKRSFAQPVMLSEVIAMIQMASGVVAVDIDKLYRVDDAASGLNARLPAALPALDENGDMLAAELLTLDSSPLDALKVLS